MKRRKESPLWERKFDNINMSIHKKMQHMNKNVEYYHINVNACIKQL